MAIKVYKVADIVENRVNFVRNGSIKIGDLASILTNLPSAPDPVEGGPWEMMLTIGEGASAKTVVIELPQLLDKRYCPDDEVIFLQDQNDYLSPIAFFRNALFFCERAPSTNHDKEEVILRVKKAVYDEAYELLNLRAVVANLESAQEFLQKGRKRDAIPEDVKMAVWVRDGGLCSYCGSNNNLHFDHIIPFSKGGGNSVQNIQILCQPCNLQKADKIAL